MRKLSDYLLQPEWTRRYTLPAGTIAALPDTALSVVVRRLGAEELAGLYQDDNPRDRAASAALGAFQRDLPAGELSALMARLTSVDHSFNLKIVRAMLHSVEAEGMEPLLAADLDWDAGEPLEPKLFQYIAGLCAHALEEDGRGLGEARRLARDESSTATPNEATNGSNDSSPTSPSAAGN